MSEASGQTGLRAQGRVGTVINGKWRIEARLGAGGMSTVYSAVNRTGTRAALKMLNIELSREETIRQRFLREGYLANRVEHPGVCRVLDDGYAEDGCAYLVLELLEGETMEERRLRTGGVMPLEEVLEFADQALATIAAAHEKGIVHRDVKPENVFLTTAGQVKLLDFGLARMRDEGIEATATGITIGTPEFMAPEQAMGKSDLVDARSDVWGVGAMIFTSVSGKYVHETNTLHQQLLAAATQRARSVLTVAPALPRAIAQVVDKALELDRDDRWASAGDMRRALRAARGIVAPVEPAAQSITQPADLPLSSQPISSDKTITRSSPAPMSDGPTLESAVQTRPAAIEMPSPHRTERLNPALLGRSQPTMPIQLATQHLSSGSMPSHPRASAPPGPPTTLAASGSYSYAPAPPTQHPAPPPAPMPAENVPAGRGAAIASVILLLTCAAAAAYLYLRGMPHLP